MLRKIISNKQRIKNGFTLVEVLVATGVVTMVLVGIASGTSFAVRNTRFSQEKAASVRHAQEAVEWLRGRRDIMGWPAFYQAISQDGSNINYCLTTLPTTQNGFVGLTSMSNPLNNCNPIDDTFIRSANIRIENTSELTVIMQVAWTEGNPDDYETTTLETSLREWR